MYSEDVLRYASRALIAHGARSWLTLLAVALGTAAVVSLSAVGEGARRYVQDQLAELGTHLLIVIPGRNETTGGPPPMLGETPRDLTLVDALALLRSPHIARIAPVSMGAAPVSAGSLTREVSVLGSTAEFFAIRHLRLAGGRILPPGDPERGRAVIILGETLASELFGGAHPIGRFVRVGDRRFRVIGLLASSGVSLGTDLADLAVIPVATAQQLFDNPGLFRILVEARRRQGLDAAKADILSIIRDRHDGDDDVTVIAQDAMLGTFDEILRALTLAAAGIAGVSLVVAGVLIMNVMLVAVSQRTAEIGLLKALGAGSGQVTALFLTEAVLLAGSGTLLGIGLAFAGISLFNHQYPEFPLPVPAWAPLLAAGVSLGTGLVFGLLPARRAARMDPVRALAGR